MPLNFSLSKKTKIRQTSDLSPAILEAKVSTDYFHINSATQEPSTSEGNQSGSKRENPGHAVTEKAYHTHA